ncbi:MAG TPA: endonuclease/exonuclease/phosphatase family protein [Pseudonocardiaceae bacterium]|nr:endonuclease/exonuclease/phosphatase family protein [Pseudonocardiaceae bacterium]
MVKVGTWNVENLSRPGSEAGPKSEQAYEAKLTALVRTITTLAPDVLAVQDVDEPEAFKDLIGRLGQGWRSELADPDGRGIRVGFLSQLPLDRVDQVREFLPQLRPIQVDDTDTTINQMGRPHCTSSSRRPGERWIWSPAI